MSHSNGSWFGRHERFGDCAPNEVYIGQNVFAGFRWVGNSTLIDFRRGDGQRSIMIDPGGVSILAGALAEWTGRAAIPVEQTSIMEAKL